MLTPDAIREKIVQVQVELRRAPDIIEGLEAEAERAELAASAVVDQRFLASVGNVEERKAMARLDAAEVRDVAVISRAAFNRGRLKVRLLEAELMSLQALLKSVQAEL